MRSEADIWRHVPSSRWDEGCNANACVISRQEQSLPRLVTITFTEKDKTGRGETTIPQISHNTLELTVYENTQYCIVKSMWPPKQ